jgi:hypothetical protein
MGYIIVMDVLSADFDENITNRKQCNNGIYNQAVLLYFTTVKKLLSVTKIRFTQPA